MPSNGSFGSKPPVQLMGLRQGANGGVSVLRPPYLIQPPPGPAPIAVSNRRFVAVGVGAFRRTHHQPPRRTSHSLSLRLIQVDRSRAPCRRRMIAAMNGRYVKADR